MWTFSIKVVGILLSKSLPILAVSSLTPSDDWCVDNWLFEGHIFPSIYCSKWICCFPWLEWYIGDEWKIFSNGSVAITSFSSIDLGEFYEQTKIIKNWQYVQGSIW